MQKRLILPVILCFSFQLTHAQERMPDTAAALKSVLVQYNQRLELSDNIHSLIDINDVLANYFKPIPLATGFINPDDQSKSKDSLPSTFKRTMEGSLAKHTVKKDTFNKSQVLETIDVGYYKITGPGVAVALTKISGDDIKDLPASDIASLIQGRCAGCEVIQSSGSLGSSAQITIRGVGSLNQPAPLYVIDGVVQPHDAMSLEAGNNINTNDIANIVILKDAGATAIYGSAAAGGVIIVTTKSGRGVIANSNAKTVLSEEEDIDYMDDIQSVDSSKQYSEYLSLEPQNNTKLSFYLDMAQHFYSEGLTSYTDTMMLKAKALCRDTLAGQTAVAFVYEYMKQYDKAIAVYKDLVNYYPGNLKLVRDLAWSYYENKEYDAAVKILYNAIVDPGYADDDPTIKLKDIMLTDMNMIIALHKKDINSAYIPVQIIKPVAADMRILMESNNWGLAGMFIKEKGKHRLDHDHVIGKDSARLQNAGDDFSLTEFETAHIGKKQYSITIPYDSKGWYPRSPTLVRVIKITNFGKADQSIDTDIVSLDNQYGQIEIEKFLVKE
jgi:TonB-dependent SusC/RagA subfamily outer membrane receptor